MVRRGAVARISLALTLAAGLALQGCGGPREASQIQASMRALHTAFAKRDARAACAAITGTYWAALRQRLDGEVQGLGSAGLPGADCRGDLGYLFANASPSAPSLVVTRISIHGDTATGMLVVNGGPPGPARFVKGSDHRWRLDCCTGSQQEALPEGQYRIPSGAMLPTLKIGQVVTTDNAAMRAHPPAIGDIIVFHPPSGADGATPQCGNATQGGGHPQVCDAPTAQASGQTFIKRVVGLPGDRIAMIDGHVIRNGVRERDPYIAPCGNGPAACTFPKPVVIPAGEFFVLGDNRGNSDDSRFWGPVRRAWIIGVVRP